MAFLHIKAFSQPTCLRERIARFCGDAAWADRPRDGGGKREVIASVGELKDLQSFTKRRTGTIVRGNVLSHIPNGRLMCQVIDDDMKQRRMEGLLGVQVP